MKYTWNVLVMCVLLVCSNVVVCTGAELVAKQQEFTRCKALLITYAYEQGYKLTDGDAFRDERLHGRFGEAKGYGSPNSLHKLRLAQDFNLWVEREMIESSDHPAWGTPPHFLGVFRGSSKDTE